MGWQMGSGLTGLGGLMVMQLLAQDQSSLRIVYPPVAHQTTAPQIFIIGTAPPQQVVTVNGQVISQRSPAGHFAPSIPLEYGENQLRIQAGTQTQILRITRPQPTPITGLTILEPARNLSRLPHEPICFAAQAPANSTLHVQISSQKLPLLPIPTPVQLPPNSAALTQTNQPEPNPISMFRGCTQFDQPGDYVRPQFQLTGPRQESQLAPGTVQILNPSQLRPVQVIRPLGGIARTGPSTDYARLTPLPPSTYAIVTGQTGDWFRLNYGAWINQSETQPLPSSSQTRSIIRSITSRQIPGWTEIRFPLEVPVPLAVDVGEKTFTLKLFNTTAQTDVIRLDADPVISRLDWQQTGPGEIVYRFQLHHQQQWGYRLRYEGTTLVLGLRHPPQLGPKAQPLVGMKILLDAGHGGPEDSGAIGPTGDPEKKFTLILAKLLETELRNRGATVIQTRTTDKDLDLPERIMAIEASEPTLALSLHYNALPDQGDALKTQGIGAFWYQAQSHSLAVFLEDYLATQLNRPRYGVFWNNLALTRPTVAPAVLLELGFMINPWEFEWIADETAQKQLAKTLADGIVAWLQRTQRS
ncbi:N-acetylmuramoyl-L-alanine amidase [Thermosynechococcaceae cyanobacterium BACA0444]|uniref:N-acetylmuramoyl-L-alanine amidase n=1 Tax=Pseudocalidococcus azoricus BACA0444 TaxID=2918990 RepID=A0AAE4JVI5_9CYAN|nr:N-acetylmuramoyl-L-alanine amidase [Pseudocalidococcus azoricus]MDS3860066.1 N-acetylmuramoyl-L-alanine amidase [Pseudocalidococcus azoricus BACA0444]